MKKNAKQWDYVLQKLYGNITAKTFRPNGCNFLKIFKTPFCNI